MELQGALPPERARALAAHLDTCGACAAFAAEARRSQALLCGPAPVVPAESLVRRVRRVQSEDRWRLGSVGAGLLATGGLLGWSTGSAALGLGVTALVALLVLPSAHLRGRRLAREVARAGRGHEELLAVYRRDLEARLRRWTRLRTLAFAFATFQLAAGVVGPSWPASLRPIMSFYLFGTAAVCLVRALYLGFRTLPALRRELQELR